ncbi:hypothetical protein CAP42_06000 [Acinetobacter indicus]|uniref:hypothetical protein n=1 Tax=Acinetobacter indicus TaxID=756892 RepID=UPI0005F79909|nr:hypothetical protein [Acinetobacter indicus]KJV43736.1 hypothetical protein VH96_10535 [Acinetobacter indicus]OUY10552.1 hypothetical protein CAP42_06000 [Acinetobacter indicus]
MAIETKDLVLYKSERLTDTDDGGGKYSGQVIIDGQSNNLFNDVSEMDRTMGDVSMRKIFPAVITEDTDSLMGATVFISENPQDPNVSALLFSTKNWTDERRSAQNRVENYLAKGGQIAGTPLDTHWQGMKQLQVAMFPQEAESSVGDTIVLVSDEGKALEFEQYVRITKVETRIAIMVINGREVQYKVATYTINDPLERDFIGLSARQWYDGQASITIIRESLVADTGEYCASVKLASDAQVGEFTVNASSMFTQLIPSAQTETPIIDVNAAGESIILVPGNDGSITANFPTTVGVSQNLYLGSSVMPSSIAFTLFGQPVSDQGGLLKNSQGTQVGTIDYQRGLIQWTSAAGAGSTTLAITFKPAAAPKQYFQSYAIPVTQNSQSSNWTGVLIPIPAPGSLTLSYMSQGKFYELKDDGSGQLKGVHSSFGSGMINYETGSFLLTTGALPDVDTPILAHWGTPIATFVRAGLPVDKAGFDFDLGQTGISTGITVTWVLEGETKTASSNAKGLFTGDATGYVNYAAGKGRIIPNKLPQKNTQFNITYNYGPQLSQTKTVAPAGDQVLGFTIGTGSSIQPSSVALEIPVTDQSGLNTLIVHLKDDPTGGNMGNLINDAGDIQGTIDYNTGQCIVTPTASYKTFNYVYEARYTATYASA